MATITLDVDEKTAEYLEAATEQQRKKLKLLLRLRLHELIDRPRRSLEEIMDDMSDQAEANGLTHEILESILNDNDQE